MCLFWVSFIVAFQFKVFFIRRKNREWIFFFGRGKKGFSIGPLIQNSNELFTIFQKSIWIRTLNGIQMSSGGLLFIRWKMKGISCLENKWRSDRPEIYMEFSSFFKEQWGDRSWNWEFVSLSALLQMQRFLFRSLIHLRWQVG